MRSYAFSLLVVHDGEPNAGRAVLVGGNRSVGLTVVVDALQYEDPPGTVRATIQSSNDASNWTDIESFDVDGDVRVGTFSLASALFSRFVRVKVSMANGLMAIVDIELTLSPPKYVAP